MPATKTEETIYSEKMEGDRGNYKWIVAFDITDGYVGINQWADDGKIGRVLLSPAQVAALTDFIKDRKAGR